MYAYNEPSSIAPKFLGTLAAALLGAALLLVKLKVSWLVALGVAGAAGVIALGRSASLCFIFFFGYLFFEGMAKVVTNYNPVIHLASDMLLILTFVKYWSSHNFLAPGRKQIHPQNLDRPILVFLTIYWLWVGLQYLNPFGLGLIPSLAAMKIYAVPVLTFFIAFYFAKFRTIRVIPYVILAFGLFEALFAVFDWYMGDSFVPSLHPRYRAILGIKFLGPMYRPFGTTFAPGGPSLFMFLVVPAALFVIKDSSVLSRSKNYTWKAIATLFFLAAPAALIVGQVRTMMLRFVAIISVGIFVRNLRSAVMFLVITGLCVGTMISTLPYVKQFADTSTPFGAAIDRIASLTEIATYTEARSGGLERMEYLGSFTINGIGLSRTGAASAKWDRIIKEDPYFGKNFSFTDNAYLTLFTEIGLGGLVAYIFLFLTIFIQLLRHGHYFARVVAGYTLILMLAGLGSEEILYSPGSALFWFYVALALRYQNPEDRHNLTATGGAT